MAKRTLRIGTTALAAAGALALTGCAGTTATDPEVDVRSHGTSVTVPTVGGAQPVPPPGAEVHTGEPATLDGEYRVDMGDVGTATVEVAGFTLRLAELTPGPGWQVVKEEYERDEIEIDLRNGPMKAELEVEIDDGRLDTEVEVDRPAVPGPYTYPAGDAGAVTIDTDGRSVTLLGQATEPGWVATVDERDLARGEVDIVFRDETGRIVEFEAEIDDGELEIEIETKNPPQPR